MCLRDGLRAEPEIKWIQGDKEHHYVDADGIDAAAKNQEFFF